MDTLDNANNPFAIPNKTSSDSVNSANEDALLLNITDGLKKNDDLPNNDLIKMLEKSNCDRLTPEFDDEDNLGPETDVDNPEDGSLSPNLDVMKLQSEALNNNQNLNPFNDIEKTLTMNWNLKEDAFDGPVTPSEEICPLPTNAVNNVPQLIDAGPESDSEEDEEWNYVRGEEANKENAKPVQLNSKVAEEEEDLEDTMSQLNPNAAEFVPVSPVRVVASPLGRVLDDELVLSQSPKKPPPTDELDLNVPSPVDFEKDISQKPHELEETISNGHQSELENEPNTLNSHRSDEFHFGPNAAPFTPVKMLDQSEASSTKAVFGDDTELTLDSSFNNSTFDQEQTDFISKDDPMSMSFHQDRADDMNPFDLNKVHRLPDDVDEFINQADKSNSLLNDTISDLTEHFPLGKPEENEPVVLSQPVTDFDKEDNKVATSTQDEVLVSPCNDKLEEILPVTKEEHTSSFSPESSEPLEEDRNKTPIQEDVIISPSVENTTVFKVDGHTLETPVEEKEACSPLEEKEACSPTEDKLMDQVEENGECTPVLNEITEELDKNICSLVENEIAISSVQEKEITSILQKDTVNSPFVLHAQIGDQLIPSAELEDYKIETEDLMTSTELAVENDRDICIASTPCDNTESVQPVEPVTSASSPDNDEFLKLESEKCDLEKAKENTENLLQLDTLSTVMSSEVICPMPDTTISEIVCEKSPSTTDLLRGLVTSESSEVASALPDETIQKEQVLEAILKDDDVSSSVPEEEHKLPQLNLEIEDTRCADFHSQPTPESDQPLLNNAGIECLLNTSTKSAADTESVATAEVNSFLERSLLADMESPLSPNLSNVCLEVNEHVIPNIDINQLPSDAHESEPTQECTVPVSPPRETEELLNLTSISAAGRPSSINLEPLSHSPVEASTPKAKEVDKKAPKGRVSSATQAKKTPASRSSLGASKPGTTPSPRPASSRLSTRPSPLPPKMNSTSKTESVTTAKTASKPLTSTAPKSSVSARVPLTSRTTKSAAASKTNATNDDVKPASKPTNTTGAVRKTQPGNGTKSMTLPTSSRPTSSITRAPLASARSVPPTTAPKSKPSTASAAPSKTTTATKNTNTTKPSVTAPKLSTVTSKTSSTVNRATLSKTNSKPKPATEKQIKETANKLTASKTTIKAASTTQVVSKTTTRKVEEKVTGTKTTSRSTTTTAAFKPIKKPTDLTKTATTKVGKPKQNGETPPTVTEQIIVNNATNQLNGIDSNGDQRFVKDNSPVDNKLIVDSLTETAAN